MKKGLILMIVLVLTISLINAEGVTEIKSPVTIEKQNYDDQFIDLQGEWHFKVYRKYDKMFQYFNYGGVKVTWEDSQAALVPTADVYSKWETVRGPNPDYSTGGLQQMNRDPGMGAQDDRSTLAEFDLFPKWSEAWYCKSVTIPKGFIKDDTVTLLLGIIDDLDVVYVNGVPVGASGFKTPDGAQAPAKNVPETGGFAAGGDFQFETSYWEVPRQYIVDSSLLREGENDLCIRLYNNNSFGGFYDRPMAFVATNEALRYLKGRPTDRIENDSEMLAFVKKQNTAYVAEDILAYKATLSDDYNQNELNKTEKIIAMSKMFADYTDIRISDVDAGCYSYNGQTVYSAQRVVTGKKDGKAAVIEKNENFLIYLEKQGNEYVDKGNWSHCYAVDYTSTLEGMNNTTRRYSIYLPPSYYTEPFRSYPVVYLLHGINSTGDSFVNVDKIESRMNEWIESGLITEMIVVMPNAGKQSGYTDTDAPKGPSDSAGPWASFIYKDIVGEVDRNYRTLPQPEFRGISGISMGGGGVFKVGVAHPEVFTSYASHMGAVPKPETITLTTDSSKLAKLDFYLDHGIQDHMTSHKATAAMAEYLESVGTNVTWELRDGGHNSAFYMTGMPKSMKMHSDHFMKNGLK
jgi:S-formylglutathione hydrolase FrmB